MRAALFLAIALGLAGPAAAAPAMVKLDAAAQARLGVATAPLAAARHTTSAPGFARALDVTPLATLDADIATAVAALSASQREADRARALNAEDKTVSTRSAETATAQARADAARLTLLRRRLGLEWGPAIAGLSDSRRGGLVAELAAGRAALVRIDAAAGPPPRGGAVSIDLGPEGHATAAVLGPARVADPRLPSTGSLAVVRGRGASAMGLGLTAPVELSGASSGGVIVPRAALVRTGGATFVYVRRDATSFERREVAGQADAAGLFVTQGLAPGAVIVTAGAAKLLTAERGSSAEED